MSKEKYEIDDEVDLFLHGLKNGVRSWLASQRPPRTQTWLARKLYVSSQDVSSNLNPTRPMTEGFIKKLSHFIPEWSHAYLKYLEIKGGETLQADFKSAVEKKKSKAERIKRLRAAEEGVIAAIRALTETAIEVLEDKD